MSDESPDQDSDEITDQDSDDRLDKLGERIDDARQQAEDAGILDDPEEQRFFESGEEGEDSDDQTVAPPG